MGSIEKMADALEAVLAIVEPWAIAGMSTPAMTEAVTTARQAVKYYRDDASHSNASDRCISCGEKTKYQGWENYETWSVHLQLSNDQGSDETCREYAEEADSVGDLARALKDYWEEYADEMWPSEYPAQFPFCDLLTAAQSEVDWHEIAQAYWDDVEHETDEDEE